MPCAGESCEAPQGTFEARQLERALERYADAERVPGDRGGDPWAPWTRITMCENGEDACSARQAWEVVESPASANKKRRTIV